MTRHVTAGCLFMVGHALWSGDISHQLVILDRRTRFTFGLDPSAARRTSRPAWGLRRRSPPMARLASSCDLVPSSSCSPHHRFSLLSISSIAAARWRPTTPPPPARLWTSRTISQSWLAAGASARSRCGPPPYNTCRSLTSRILSQAHKDLILPIPSSFTSSAVVLQVHV